MAEPHDGYAPDPKFLDAFPDVSGNDINGLGETNPRPVTASHQWEVPHQWRKRPRIIPTRGDRLPATDRSSGRL